MAIVPCLYNKIMEVFVADEPDLNIPEQFFKEILSLYADKGIDKEECIKNCCLFIEQTLDPTRYPLSLENQLQIDLLLKQFVKAAYHSGRFSMEEIMELGSRVNFFVENKWCFEMAKNIHSIAALSDETERKLALETWAKQFFVGVHYWWAQEKIPLEIIFVLCLVEKTQGAFRLIYQEEYKNRNLNILKRLEIDPRSVTEEERLFLATGRDEKEDLIWQAIEVEFAQKYLLKAKL